MHTANALRPSGRRTGCFLTLAGGTTFTSCEAASTKRNISYKEQQKEFQAILEEAKVKPLDCWMPSVTLPSPPPSTHKPNSNIHGELCMRMLLDLALVIVKGPDF